jgi:regulator of cell morphogenesis and NO signaling
MQAVQEQIINVPEIEPRLKHPTIFQVFDSLNGGESLVIHNDHDPKPVYYQLLGERGDIFTWQYLEQGPEWWKVRITKKQANQSAAPMAKSPNQPAAKQESKDIVINVPEIEPKLKHPTIFQVFDELSAGESLVIHNDHDPKPVYYQLLGERGDVFVWQYLEQGPQWWDVRVTKKGAEDKETVGQIAAKDLRKAEVFKKYGIDFCCGGKKTVREICSEKGIDATKVEQELQQTSQTVTSVNNAYNEWNLDFLADYIVNTHHSYVRKYLPEMQAYALKVARVHGGRHPELLPILNQVTEINDELSAHLVEEETVLFPLVKQIVQAKNAGTQLSKSGNESLATLIAQMEKEHDSVGRALDEIRRLSNDFELPKDACASYSLFYKMIQEFENDLHLHIHLENNILFPKAVDMEQSLA